MHHNTNVSSKGMKYEEATEVIEKIEKEYGLGYIKTIETKIGGEVKFIDFSVSIKIDND